MFWELQVPDPRATALIAGDEPITYAELSSRVAQLDDALEGGSLGLLLARNDLQTTVWYLALLRGGRAVWLLDPDTPPDTLRELTKRYSPHWIHGAPAELSLDGYTRVESPQTDDGTVLRREVGSPVQVHPDLGLLMSTSGSTGSPRLVRISRAALAANARSIAVILLGAPERDQEERAPSGGDDSPGHVSRRVLWQLPRPEIAPTTLPLHYAYGLSVLNSHLEVGGTVLLTEESVVSRRFWEQFGKWGCTSLAGVPFTWQVLKRLRLERMELPTLRTMTQAGGKLAPELVRHFHEVGQQKGARFVVMYGQTEATARIAWVPPEFLPDKAATIGKAIPGGALHLEPVSDPGVPSGAGELVYEGPNVMMGYAEDAADLARGDELQGVLRTGDLATVDHDGFYTIVGRMKRFIKVTGRRIGLDHLQASLTAELGLPVVCLGEDDLLKVALQTDSTEASAARERALSSIRDRLRLHPRNMVVICSHELPRSSRGKIDLAAAAALFGKEGP